MVQLIVGEKGKGKTKVLLDKANNGVKGLSCISGQEHKTHVRVK